MGYTEEKLGEYQFREEIWEELGAGVLPVEIVYSVPPVSKFLARQIIADYQETVRRHKTCDKRGHKLVADGSFGNGETGGEYGHCTHCGWTFDITYY